VNETLNFTLSAEELAQLVKAKQTGVEALTQYQKLSIEEQKKQWQPEVFKPILVAIKNIIDKKTNTGWGSISPSGTHTAVDVPVFSFGKNSELFRGFQDNTDIAKKIFTLLGKKD